MPGPEKAPAFGPAPDGQHGPGQGGPTEPDTAAERRELASLDAPEPVAVGAPDDGRDLVAPSPDGRIHLDAAAERRELGGLEPALERDDLFMREALAEAEAAAAAEDVPVGALVVSASGLVLARGRNRREADRDPTAHAEIEALREAARVTGAWRLLGATVYSTLEPCPMCAGALVNARIARLVYACPDPKAGAVDTLFTIGRDERLNHRFEVTRGVLSAESSALLRAFFAARRKRPAP